MFSREVSVTWQLDRKCYGNWIWGTLKGEGGNYNLTGTRLQRHSLSFYLEIRWRNEEAINSTRNRIYSLNVFYFLLYRSRFVLLVSELIYYVNACKRRLEIRLRSQAIRVYKYTKIQVSRFQRNYIVAKDAKSYLHGTSFQSSPKIIQWKFTTPDHRRFAIKFRFLFFSTTQFQSNQRFLGLESRGHVSEKL